jgi:hypothetical protein
MRIKPFPPLGVGLATVLAGAGLIGAPVSSQAGDTYAIDWYAIGSGGTVAVGDQLKLSGTIAQAVAGPSASDSYTLDAGFWYGMAIECADCIFANDFELED